GEVRGRRVPGEPWRSIGDACGRADGRNRISFHEGRESRRECRQTWNSYRGERTSEPPKNGPLALVAIRCWRTTEGKLTGCQMDSAAKSYSVLAEPSSATFRLAKCGKRCQEISANSCGEFPIREIEVHQGPAETPPLKLRSRLDSSLEWIVIPAFGRRESGLPAAVIGGCGEKPHICQLQANMGHGICGPPATRHPRLRPSHLRV